MKQVLFVALGLAMLSLGCQPTVDEVCEDLGECNEFDANDCLTDGNKLQSNAESRGCEDAFEEYIDCVADAVCSYRQVCHAERSALESCAGSFPQ
ncbi:hypothetical protein KEG38_50350 [Polyangium jinanense]|uniref:hypothetical protein n=1 Tax=Polyangium jinanense TaxID=2829994 RepID=UPI00233FF355|nr:hypothetical protein [Polyangium jinanense]MDC3962121.1 hypothetical protein [Polyangium jinanense]